MNKERKQVKLDYRKLSLKIIEVYETHKKFAKVIGASESKLSRFFNHKAFLSQGEILEWADLLGIKHLDIPDYFFCPCNDKMD